MPLPDPMREVNEAHGDSAEDTVDDRHAEKYLETQLVGVSKPYQRKASINAVMLGNMCHLPHFIGANQEGCIDSSSIMLISKRKKQRGNRVAWLKN